MRVIHYLKDGSRVKNITGHVVKMEDAGALYNLIRSINDESKTKKSRKLPGENAGSVSTSQN